MEARTRTEPRGSHLAAGRDAALDATIADEDLDGGAEAEELRDA
jgi:hypothetical protein